MQLSPLGRLANLPQGHGSLGVCGGGGTPSHNPEMAQPTSTLPSRSPAPRSPRPRPPQEVVRFCTELCAVSNALVGSEVYAAACEHAHSVCVLLAHRKFLRDGHWHTWSARARVGVRAPDGGGGGACFWFRFPVCHFFVQGDTRESMALIPPPPKHCRCWRMARTCNHITIHKR